MKNKKLNIIVSMAAILLCTMELILVFVGSKNIDMVQIQTARILIGPILVLLLFFATDKSKEMLTKFVIVISVLDFVLNDSLLFYFVIFYFATKLVNRENIKWNFLFLVVLLEIIALLVRHDFIDTSSFAAASFGKNWLDLGMVLVFVLFFLPEKKCRTMEMIYIGIGISIQILVLVAFIFGIVDRNKGLEYTAVDLFSLTQGEDASKMNNDETGNVNEKSDVEKGDANEKNNAELGDANEKNNAELEDANEKNNAELEDANEKNNAELEDANEKNNAEMTDNRKTDIKNNIVFEICSVEDNDYVLTKYGNEVSFRKYEGIVQQQFTLEPVEDGFYKIICLSDGKVLDVRSGAFVEGNSICAWEDVGVPWQQWYFESVYDRYCAIRSTNWDYVMSYSNEGKEAIITAEMYGEKQYFLIRRSFSDKPLTGFISAKNGVKIIVGYIVLCVMMSVLGYFRLTIRKK